MKRIHVITIIGLMVCATMLTTGCKKEDGKVALRAKIAQESDSKIYMNGNRAYWHEGDLVNINGEEIPVEGVNGAVANFSGVNQSSQYYAVYPADIVTMNNCNGNVNVNLHAVQVYEEDNQGHQIVKVPLGGTNQSEDNINVILYRLSSLVKIVFSSEMDFTLERIELTAAGHALSGAGTATITEDGVGNTITMANSDTSHTVALDFSQSGNQQIRHGERNTYVYYIPVPSYAGADDITITLWGSHRGIGVAKIVEKEDVTLSRNSIATVMISVKGEWDWIEELDPNELRGVFSIGNGRTVRFSRGNLQYDRINEAWQFAQHQYDFIGSENIDGSNPFQLGSVIDLFGWGSWVPGGVSPTYLGDNVAYHQPSGWYSSYSGIEGEWYTMTAEEWHYLIYERPGGGNNVGLSYVGDEEILGLVILPDEWVLPNGCSFDGGTIVSSEGDGEVNYFSDSQWEAMEAAGAVFLPAAGERYRHIEDVVPGSVPEGYLSYIGYTEEDSWNGNYWTTTTPSSAWDEDHILATALYFGYDGIDYGSVYLDSAVGLRSNGYSVRLVKICSSNSIGSKNSIIGKKNN